MHEQLFFRQAAQLLNIQKSVYKLYNTKLILERLRYRHFRLRIAASGVVTDTSI